MLPSLPGLLILEPQATLLCDLGSKGHNSSPQQIIIGFQMSIVPKLRNSALVYCASDVVPKAIPPVFDINLLVEPQEPCIKFPTL